MANGDDVALQGEILKAHARAACSRALTLLAQYRDLATEERVAATMDRMEVQQPENARQCRVYSQQAREQASLWRQRAARWG